MFKLKKSYVVVKKMKNVEAFPSTSLAKIKLHYFFGAKYHYKMKTE